MNFSQGARQWLSQATGIAQSELRVTKMSGANSSLIFLVRSASPNCSKKFVLRVIDNRQWLSEAPDLTAHEANALLEARKAGLNAPRLVDFTSEDIGFGGPAVLMSHLSGSVDIQPLNLETWLRELASNAASIHRHKADGFSWSFSSWIDRPRVVVPEWTRVPTIWKRAIERLLQGEPAHEPVFIHRDYHPLNVLWNGDGAISGTVDWVNACRGPAHVDVAHCRTNLAQMFGFEVADRFLEMYLDITGEEGYDPYWDIESILDMNLPEPEFYKPWAEFGFEVIPIETLKSRIDSYLESVVKRL